MKKFAWITDSTCGLSDEFLKENNVHVIPLNVVLNGVSYKENIEITADEFYEKLHIDGIDAKTSQPAYGDFINLFEEVKKEYECGIAIHASSALTGTYQSAKNASKQTGFPVEVIDSKIGAYALGKMIKNGLELVKQGISFDKIVEKLRMYTNQTEMYLLPSSLDQLKKSGRVSTPQAIFASLLNINLLLKFRDGKVVVDEKIRTKVRAKNHLFQIIDNAVKKHNIEEICVMHAGVIEKAQNWKTELEKLHE